MNDLDKQIKEAGNNPALLKRLQAERSALADEIKVMKDYVKALKQAQTDINSIAAKVKTKQSLADVKSDNRNAKQVASRLDPGNKQQAKDLEKINKIIGEQNYKIREQEKAMKAVVMPAKELGKVLGNLKSAPLDQLKNAEAELVRQLSQATRGTEEFARTNSRLQAVRQQIQATGESMKGVAMSTTQLNNTMRSLSTAPMQKLKTAEEQLKRAIADGNLTEKQREKTLKNLSSVQREITKREQEAAAATKKGAQAAKDASIGYKGYQKTLTDQKATMEQLKRAAQELKEKMEKAAPNSAQYKQYAKTLQDVNARIKEGTDQHTKHASAISQAMSRLKTYVMIYMGFNKLLDVLRNFKTAVLGLSDSIADIQKVTKMSAEDVDRLSLAINRLDTRSSIEQLHKLGYQAGLLGLTSQRDILGFVKAADQMNWALKELGEEGAVNLMKVANLTHETEKYGVEGALKKIGSAINEITANSAASAGPVTEIVSRLGAVGSVAGYASAELVAIGSTMNALGVKSEMGATAVNKIMIALNNNLPAIALHSGLVADELKKLKDDTDALYAKGESNMTGAMAVMMAVLQKLHETSEASGNTLATLQPIFKDMGKEGTRLATTLTNLVDNVDTLGEHLDITSSAFDEGVSMLNEYNVKNETAAALLDRLKNALVETFVNSGTTRWLQSILKEMVKVVNHTGFWYRALVSLGTILGAIGTWKFVVFLKDSVLWLGHAAVATNTWAKSIVAAYITRAGGTIKTTADTAANVANTASITANTGVRYTNAAATEEGVVASVAQTGANEAETVSWAQLAAAMWACPFTWMAAAVIAVIVSVGALSVGIAYLCGAFEKQSEMQKAVNRASDEASASMIEEKVEAERLFTSLESLVEQEKKYEEELKNAKKDTDAAKEAEEKLHRTQQDRVKITNTINEKYPQYIGYLSTEKLRLDDVRDAAHAVNVELERKGQLMIRDAQLEAMQESLKDSFVKFNEDVGTDLHDLTRNEGLTDEQRMMFEAHMKSYIGSLIQSGNSSATIYNWARWEARKYDLDNNWDVNSKAYKNI